MADLFTSDPDDLAVIQAALKITDLVDLTPTGAASSRSLVDWLGGDPFNGTGPFDSKALSDATSTVNGYYSNYECKALSKTVFVNSQVLPQTEDGAMREAHFVQTQETDTYDYEGDGYRAISSASRFVINGPRSNPYTFATSHKDLHGVTVHALGKVGGSVRAVSGVIALASQYGTGVTTNEFEAENPAGSDHSVLLTGIFGICSNGVADADGSHNAWGVSANMRGYTASAAFRAWSGTYAGQPGYAQRGLDLGELTVTTGAIRMPASSTGVVGTIIEYDTNDYTFYNRATNEYRFVIAGTSYLNVNAAGISSAAYYVGANKVLGARDTGWAAMTGTTDKASVYDTSTVTLAQLAGRVMAMQAALTTHGILGA